MMIMMMGLLAAALGQVASASAPSSTEPPASQSAVVPDPGQLALATLFTDQDYPAEAVRNEEHGIVAFVVTIGRDGKIASCTVTASSGSASLDRATCDIVRTRASFGVTSDMAPRSISARISWQLPPAPFAERNHMIIYAVGAAGQVTGCRVEGTMKVDPRERCAAMRGDAAREIAKLNQQASLAGDEFVLEQGMAIGGLDAVRLVGRHAGENKQLMEAFALTVAPDGTISDCEQVEGVLPPAYAEAHCALFKRGQFEPLDPSIDNRSARHIVSYMAAYVRPARPETRSSGGDGQ